MILLCSFVSPKEPKAFAEFYLPAITLGIATRSSENSAFLPVGMFVGLQKVSWQGRRELTPKAHQPAPQPSFLYFLFHLSYSYPSFGEDEVFPVVFCLNKGASLFFCFAKRTKSIGGILSHYHNFIHCHPVTRKFRFFPVGVFVDL